MKKNIIALAIASAIAAPVVMADAPTVYGIANVAVNGNAAGKDMGMTVDNVASRLGVKGSEDLGNGLKAVYQFEFSVNIDPGTITARNQFVGLAGGFGTVLMGRHDTPLKMSQPKDLFDDGSFDNGKMTNVIGGGEDRLPNVVAYVSPSFGGVTLVGAFVSTETAQKNAGLSNIMSFAAMYGSKKEGLYLAAAYNGFSEVKNNAGAVVQGDNNQMRVSAQYAVSGLIANAYYQSQKDKGSVIVASAGYKMGDLMPKIKYAMNSEDKSSGNKGSVLAAGLNYSLGKKTTAYLEVGSRDKDMGDYSQYSVGLQHKF
jgi:predicted porin